MNMKHTLAIIALALALCACAGPRTSAPAQSPDAFAVLVAAPDRAAADRVNDARRKPAETLAFIGVRPGMTALDVSAARGYTTELLARAVGPGGKVYAQNRPPRTGPAPIPPTQPEGTAAPAMPGGSAQGATPPAPTLAERARALPNIAPVQRPFEDPAPPEVANGKLDLVTLMFNYHDFGHLGVDRAQFNAAVAKALKPGGIFVIADHAGRPGTGISESGTLHRVEENFVVREVEAAGLRLVARGGFLRNPADPRDRNTPEPPMPKDEFVLKFVKP
jgi:predicted methyltransferase